MSILRAVTIRIPSDDLAKLDDIAKVTKCKSAVLIRRFVADGLGRFDAKHEDVMAYLNVMREQLCEVQGEVARASRTAERAAWLAASTLALQSSMDIPRISGPSREAAVEGTKSNMVFGIGLGKQVKDRFESGELLRKD